MRDALLLRWVLWAVVLLAWGPEAAGQARPCKSCKGAGYLPCAEHGKEDLGQEALVLYCSVVDGCTTCGGIGRVLCPACHPDETARELEAARERTRAKGAELAALDKAMGRPLRKAESEHFVLVWEMTSMKVAKQRLSEHQMLHLSLQRLEALYSDYVALFQLREADFKQKSRVFVWHLPADHQKGSLVFCGLYAPRGTKLMGVDPTYSVCGSANYFGKDEMLHRNLVHCVVHLLFSHEPPSMWVGNLRCGWVEEGLAHYFEDKYFGVCDNYCYEEQNTVFDFKGGNFKPALRKAAELGKFPPVLGILHDNTTQLEPGEHALALAMVEYLIEVDPLKFGQLGKRVRAKVDVKDALAEVYGLSPIELEKRLVPWVIEHYPKED